MDSRARGVLAWGPIGVAIAALSAGSCTTSTLPHISDADVARAQSMWPEASRTSLERGRALYRTRCSACHEPFVPATRSRATWEHVLTEMGPRAHLDAEETRLVMSYLETFARLPEESMAPPSEHGPGYR